MPSKGYYISIAKNDSWREMHAKVSSHNDKEADLARQIRCGKLTTMTCLMQDCLQQMKAKLDKDPNIALEDLPWVETSPSLIGHSTKLSRYSIRRHIQALLDLGFILEVQKGTSHHNVLYRLPASLFEFKTKEVASKNKKASTRHRKAELPKAIDEANASTAILPTTTQSSPHHPIDNSKMSP